MQQESFNVHILIINVSKTMIMIIKSFEIWKVIYMKFYPKLSKYFQLQLLIEEEEEDQVQINKTIVTKPKIKFLQQQHIHVP